MNQELHDALHTDNSTLSDSPCAIHALIDPKNFISQFLNNNSSSEKPVIPTSQLVETAAGVREAARKIGRARIKWNNPKTVMVITKAHEKKLVALTKDLVLWLIKIPCSGQQTALTVYVDAKLENSKLFNYQSLIAAEPACAQQIKFWTPRLCASNPQLFDYVIALGGDGTVLFTSWLFQTIVPPVIPFHLGSLGFLAHFDFANYERDLTAAMEQGVRINLRMRFTCTVYRHKKDPSTCSQHVAKHNSKTGQIWTKKVCSESSALGSNNGRWKSVESTEMRNQISKEMDPAESSLEEKEIPCFTTVPSETFEVLNDLVVDRGPSPYMSTLELFGDDHHLTTVQSDGLCVSTPTGSTAYSLSAGGALTHPEIAAFLITPICPHTLSFRPMLLPDSMELRICVPYNSRSTAWASFDGRGRLELKQGDHIKVAASKYPFPQICAADPSSDWFGSLRRCLKWNERQRQKPFVVIESHPNSEEQDHDPVLPPSWPSMRTSTKDGSGVFAIGGSKTSLPTGEDQKHLGPQHGSGDNSYNDHDSGDTEDEGLLGWSEEELKVGKLLALEVAPLGNIDVEVVENVV